MNQPRYVRIIHGILVLIAVLFGLATIAAGSRVLSGMDPGYIVLRPLLIYNTVMGIVYVAAGVIAWRRLDRGRHAAAAVFVLNLFVLAGISRLYATGGAVAIESIRAMTFRTAVWLALFAGLVWVGRRYYRMEHGHPDKPAGPPGA